MGVQDLCLVIVVSVLFLQFRLLCAQNLTCDPGDLRALQDLNNGFDGGIDGWGGNSSSSCCDWPCVLCNSSSSLGLSDGASSSGRVVRLTLGGRKIKGNLLSAESTFGNLDQLSFLNLSRNSLNDKIPSSLLQLPNLKVLDLSYNGFTGQVPSSIDLPAIQFFDISQNSFSGPPPVDICTNSTDIRFLNLSVNYFSGDIPPGLGNCGVLEDLNLATNNLTGSIPEDIFGLSNLSRFILQDNRLSGPLGQGIGNLSGLIQLDLSMNGLSGSIPDVFSNMKRLQYFLGHSNTFQGSIPSSLSNSSTLVFLNLRNNSLSGKITLNCTAMTSLVSLDLGSNFFNGSLPDNLPECRSLRNINLAKNRFHSGIPDNFRNFQSLAYLSLSNSSLTNISSAFDILQQCRNLTYLVLTLNFFDEQLPAAATLSFPKLRVLIAANCRIQGSVPEWLSKSTHLQLLDLSWNRLSGQIPSWFGNFDSLFYLDLSNNSLTGVIPKNITSLPSLVSRNYSLEDPSPDFPLFMKRNVSARGLQYNQVLSLPPTLDLGHNSLNGSIWPEFGNLKKLHILDLRNNFLSGSIPDSLSGMVSLETLDLSYNNLSGTLPSSLASLTFLSKFSVAYNNLSGLIPTGGQFPTFPNSSFEGTSLCGDHAPPCPSGQDQNTSLSGRSHRSNTSGKTVGMVVGIVLGVAFILGLMILIVWRTHTPREVDPEKEDGSFQDRGLDMQDSSRKFVMFQNNENNYEKLLYEDISKATDNFGQGNIIGCGGFGMVYKATLPDGRKLAIKKLSGDGGQMEREFQAEVDTLSQAQHPNLVLLQGYCIDGDDRLLIYSYMENGSLDYWLHEKPDGPARLSWPTRLKIARGAASGLAYLHDSYILHRDIKSSNILLDENYEAHLADFGLARLICAYDTHVTTDLVGTLGYIPPEYGQASVATYKGDVYSFGVVLLELLTGKRPMDICKPRGSRDLISWVLQMKIDGKEAEVFDPSIAEKDHDNEISAVLEIACCCLNGNPKDRPYSQQLVSWLGKVDADR